MAETQPTYRYPDLPPVGSAADAGLTGLGVNWNRGGEGVTPWVDYIRFAAYRPVYEGKAILESFKEDNKGGKTEGANRQDGPTVYLYMPTNIAVSYAASYTNTKFGIGGIQAAQMLGGTGTSEEVAKTLQNAAAGATPEAGFKAVADASNAISQFMGVEGSVSGSDLAAVSQGRVFNPYEEQIFNGITFRAHNFQFKLIARDQDEAGSIDAILKFFKQIMLPSYNSEIGAVGKTTEAAATAAKDSTKKDGGGSVADKLTPAFSNIKNRYLNVPYRLEVSFVRIQNVQGKLGQVGTAKSVTGLFKMKDCVVDGLQINYTPDGGYVNTDSGFVPAIDMSISLKEISLVTSEDIAQGY